MFVFSNTVCFCRKASLRDYSVNIYMTFSRTLFMCSEKHNGLRKTHKMLFNAVDAKLNGLNYAATTFITHLLIVTAIIFIYLSIWGHEGHGHMMAE